MIIGRRYIGALLLLMVLAGVIGMLSASRALATTYYVSMAVNPGPEAGTNDMSCGWHGSCGATPTAGTALDWADPQDNNWGVWWRSWTSSTGGYHAAATGEASEDNSTYCYRVKVHVKDTPGTTLGYIRYTHTNDVVTGQFTINAGPILSPANTVREVGESVYPDKDVRCGSTGAHVHQYVVSGFTTNTGRYPGLLTPEADVSTNAIGNNQASKSFSYWY